MSALRTASRALSRRPLLSLAIVASLAVSIGATTAIYSMVDAVLIRALPFAHASDLIWISSVASHRPDAPFTLPEFLDYREQAKTVDIGAYTSWSAALSSRDLTQRLQGMRISANAFEALGAAPSLGRLLVRSDDAPGADRVVLLSHSLWQQQFGGQRSVLGSSIRLNGESHTVVGVLPRRFPMPMRDVDVAVPLRPDLDPRRTVRTSVNFLRLFGRVHSGSNLASAQHELSVLQQGLKGRFPAEYATKLGVRVAPMQEYLVGPSRPTLIVLFGSVALMLAIALANVLNLLLIRATERQGEIAVRRALGASLVHLTTQMTAESAILSGIASAAGGLLAYWVVGFVAAQSSLKALRVEDAQVDGRVLAFLMALALVTTIVFSAATVLAAARTSPQVALRAANRTSRGTRFQGKLRDGLMVAQIAFAVVVAVACTALVRSLIQLERLPLGYRPDSVFTARLSLPTQRYRSGGDLAAFEQRFRAALTSNPEVAAAGVVSIAPLSGLLSAVPFTVGGRTPPSARERPVTNFRAISPDYLSAIGGSLYQGRLLAAEDDERSAPVALVSRALAKQFVGETGAVGQQLLIDDNNDGPRPVTIVGVLEDMRHVDVAGPPSFDVFIPLAQVHKDGVAFVAGSQFWTVRLRTNRSDYGTAFTRALRETDPEVAISNAGPMGRFVDVAMAPRRFAVALLSMFALIALFLAGMGVYAVIAYAVEQRRQEIGLRLALGASPVGVVRFVMRHAIGAAIVGTALGAAAALLTGRLMSGLLFGVSPGDPLALASMIGLLMLISIAASSIPAWRASRTDPIITIR